MRLLVTGANGFIGSFVAQGAVERNYETWLAMRDSCNRSNVSGLQLPTVDIPYHDKKKIKILLENQKKKYGKWQVIVHTMGLTKCEHKSDFERINYTYTRNFIEALIETEMVPDQFVYMSSLSAFGSGKKSLEPIKLFDRPTPDTLYGASKLKTEQFIRSLDDEKFPCTILRPTGVYGPREKDYFVMLKTLSHHLNPGIGYEPQYITFIYVKDLVKAIFLSIEKKAIGKSYFVADGDVWTSDEYAALAKELLSVNWVFTVKVPCCVVKWLAYLFDRVGGYFGKTPTLNIDKYHILSAVNWKCELEPLQKDLNFKADYGLRAGLKESIDWYRKNGWL